MLLPVSGTGAISALIPSMNNPLKTFDPVTFPIAISPLPWIADMTLTISSGVEVPIATTVRPTMNSEIWNLRARAAEPSVR